MPSTSFGFTPQRRELSPFPTEANDVSRQHANTLLILTSALLKTPFSVVYALLFPFCFKELNLSYGEIAFLTMVQALGMCLGSYWSLIATRSSSHIPSYFLWSHVGARLPWFIMWFHPSKESLGVVLFLYNFLHHGSFPAWIETLKTLYPPTPRNNVASWSLAISQCVCVSMAFLFHWFPLEPLQGRTTVFFHLVLCCASLDLIALGLQYVLMLWAIRIKPLSPTQGQDQRQGQQQNQKHDREQPDIQLNELWQIIQPTTSFFKFQVRFMFFGIAVVLFKPIQSVFLASLSHCSYSQMVFFLSVCRGVGGMISARAWGALLNSSSVRLMSSCLFFLSLCSTLLLLCVQMCAQMYQSGMFLLLTLAFTLQGASNTASSMLWVVSGPLFAHQDETLSPQKHGSRPYNAMNLLLSGIRGCFAPPLGQWIAISLGVGGVLWTVALMYFLACVTFARDEKNRVSVFAQKTQNL